LSVARAEMPSAPIPARQRGVPPLPLLTLVNFFNYLDRQVVYGMTPLIREHFGISNVQLGALATVNLIVFAFASLASGPLADRIGPRKVIFGGILVWAIATIGSAVSGSYGMLLFFRALVGVGEGAYGPSANALLCADAPPEKRGRAMGIYNVGMALGGTLGLCLGALLAPRIGWRNVFWVAGAPSLLLALAAAFVKAPPRLEFPTKLPAWAYLLKPTYVLALAGGITATFGASALIFWTRELVIEVRHLSVELGSIYMLFVGLVCGVGGVLVGGHAGDQLNRRAAGGHALAIGLSMLLAVPVGTAALFMTAKVPFMVLTAIAAFLLSVYNGPSAAVVDELGPPQFAATLQAVFLFGIHVLGNAPAPTVVGWLRDRSSLPLALMSAVVAFGISGVLFCVVARRQRIAAAVRTSSSSS
jgi:predicted MFS family arabinose efflux permease